jgi:hypothetical protein
MGGASGASAASLTAPPPGGPLYYYHTFANAIATIIKPTVTDADRSKRN